MPWSSEGDNVSFSGPLADLMGIVMTAYDQDVAADVCSVAAGVYVTATAVVLREILIESLAQDADATEFVSLISDAMEEDEDGNVQIATFVILDNAAEHISPEALEGWLGSSEVRNAIVDLATTAFSAE